MPQPQIQLLRAAPEIVVFTGDLVASSRLSPPELAEAMRALQLGAGEMARGSGALPPDRPPRFSAFRGDGWQCDGPEPRRALRGALILRAHLGALGRPFDTRVSIGIGAGRMPGGSLETASGPAFELSGRGLDDMRHAQRFAVAWQHPPDEAPLIRSIFALADEISRKWTPGQARVFARLLTERPRPSQERLAGLLGVTQQTVAEHLSGGGDWALGAALRALEEWA
jgi:hypothetical protein